MKEILAIVKLPTTDCIKLAAYQLQGKAREWWRSVELIEGREVMAAWTWEQFREVFLDKYFPMHEKLRHERAFLDLQQGQKSVTEYTQEFETLSRYTPHLVTPDARKVQKYIYGLIPPIRKMAMVQPGISFKEVVQLAYRLEEDHLRTRAEQPQNRDKGKRPMDQTFKGRQAGDKRKKGAAAPQAKGTGKGRIGVLSVWQARPHIKGLSQRNQGDQGATLF